MTALALISDLHGNLEAVDVVFRRIDSLGVKEIACLGDVVGYGPDPLPVTRLVMQRCKWTILGNHDWGLFHELDDFNPLAREALFYTRNQLRPSLFRPGRRTAWEFLRTLPAVGGMSRRMALPAVVLPQPDSPTSASVRPLRITSETPSTAFTWPTTWRRMPRRMGK